MNSSNEGTPRPWNILLGVTGSVAAVKLQLMLYDLEKIKIGGRTVALRLIFTKNSLNFVSIQNLDGNFQAFTDEDEWYNWKRIPDPVLHIELREWADVLVIAPLDANTLAKMANGLCDNLLTCVVRAWDRSKPLLFAPAMNTYMWDHPLTSTHLAVLQRLGYCEIPCTCKRLACGQTGFGAMADVETIVQKLTDMLSKSHEDVQTETACGSETQMIAEVKTKS